MYQLSMLRVIFVFGLFVMKKWLLGDNQCRLTILRNLPLVFKSYSRGENIWEMGNSTHGTWELNGVGFQLKYSKNNERHIFIFFKKNENYKGKLVLTFRNNRCKTRNKCTLIRIGFTGSTITIVWGGAWTRNDVTCSVGYKLLCVFSTAISCRDGRIKYQWLERNSSISVIKLWDNPDKNRNSAHATNITII